MSIILDNNLRPAVAVAFFHGVGIFGVALVVFTEDQTQGISGQKKKPNGGKRLFISMDLVVGVIFSCFGFRGEIATH